jgi:hypothetical protein
MLRHQALRGEGELAVNLPVKREVAEPLVSWWAKFVALGDRLERFERSAAGRYWAQLSATDFMKRSFAFASLAVLSAFPFLAVSSAVVGGDVRNVIVGRIGLNRQATHE